MSKKYTHVVCYTDGSSFTDPAGTGGGLHAVLFNADEIGEGVKIPDCNEIFTVEGYVKPASVNKPIKFEEGLLVRYDGLIPLKRRTAQYAELSTFTRFFIKNELFKQLVDNPVILIYTDSTYTVNTYTMWIDGWFKKNWTRDGVSPVKNLDVVQLMWEVKKDNVKRKLDVTVKYIPGHKGWYGNERTDVLAKEAATYSTLNVVEEEEVVWSLVDDGVTVETEESDNELTEIIKDATKKSELSKTDLVPDLTNTKLNYVLTNEPHPVIKVGDVDYYYHMCGNHVSPGKADDIMFCGKYIPDAMFIVAFSKKPWTYIHEIAKEHHAAVWGDIPVMRRYDSVACVHGTHLRRKAFTDACRGDKLPYDKMHFKEHGNSWMFEKLLISRIQRPPLLSYRIIGIRDELAETLRDICLKVNGNDMPNITLNDITLKLFDEDDKPRKDVYRNVDKVLVINAKQPCSDDIVPLRFTRAISLYDRTGVNRVHKPGGKWFVYCIKNGQYTFKYGIAYVSEEESLLFSAYYRNVRIIKDIIEKKM